MDAPSVLRRSRTDVFNSRDRPKTPKSSDSLDRKRTFRFPQFALQQHKEGKQRATSHLCRATDYKPNSVDDYILKLDPGTALLAEDVTRVFGYPRDVQAKYHIGKVIGAGSYGVVKECTEIATGEKYAVKTVRKVPRRTLPTARYLIKLRSEVEIMQQLGNSLDAVHLKDTFEDNDCVHMVMELCTGGALLERLEKEAYSERFIAGIARSILRFVSQCHAKGVAYRDIKPDNFLFKSMDPNSPLKATDFGLSIRHRMDEPKLQTRTGTAAYMAPEVLEQFYDQRCDLWSVGMLTYQLLTGRFPFWEDVRNQMMAEVFYAIRHDNINWDAEELQKLSRPAVDFLQRMLQRDPAQRMTAMAALEHPWIAEGSREASDLPLEGSVVQRLQRFSTYGALQQMVLRMMVDEMSDSLDDAQKMSLDLPDLDGRSPLVPVKDLQELFARLDADNSGGITQEELAQGLKQQGYSLRDREVEQLMRRVDADGNGIISAAEFMATLIDWNKIQRSKAWQSLVDRAFNRLDKDGDGNISVDELLEYLRSISPAVKDGKADEDRLLEAKQLLREADSSSDGLISKSEFLSLLEDKSVPDSLSFYDDRLA